MQACTLRKPHMCGTPKQVLADKFAALASHDMKTTMHPCDQRILSVGIGRLSPTPGVICVGGFLIPLHCFRGKCARIPGRTRGEYI